MIVEGVNELLPQSINDWPSWSLHSKLSFGRPYIPIVGCSPWNFRLTTAWHIKPTLQQPHSMKYRCLKAIIDSDMNELKKVLDNPQFDLNGLLDQKYKLTPLNLAVLFDRSYIVKYLVLRGANIEGIDNKAESPLAMAVRNCSYNSLEILIERGANIEKKDIYGFSAIDKAKIREFEAIGNYLERKAQEQRKEREKREKEGKINWDLPKFDIRFSWELNDAVFNEMVGKRHILEPKVLIYPFNDFKGTYEINVLREKTAEKGGI